MSDLTTDPERAGGEPEGVPVPLPRGAWEETAEERAELLPPAPQSEVWRLKEEIERMRRMSDQAGRDATLLRQLLKDASDERETLRQRLDDLATVRRPPEREQLPAEREAVTHRFQMGGGAEPVSGYLTVGLYADGRPGEIFLRVDKQGSTLRGMCDAWGRSVSLLLQYGVPVAEIGHKFSHFCFEPDGFFPPPIGRAKSIVDYVARWLTDRFGGVERAPVTVAATAPATATVAAEKRPESGPPCNDCGTLTQRAGHCHVCPQCGTTTGCS